MSNLREASIGNRLLDINDCQNLPDVMDEEDSLVPPLDSFIEVNEVLSLIDLLPDQCNTEKLDYDPRVLEHSVDSLKLILNQYQEQSKLLDPCLPEIMRRLMIHIQDEDTTLKVKHMSFKYLFQFISVRGYKRVVQYMPHEPTNLEPVLQLLEEQNPDDTDTWETRYCLLIWLTIIIILPFHFNLTAVESDSQKSVASRIMDLGHLYLKRIDACREAAAVALARLVVRDDVKEVHMVDFVYACIDKVAACVGTKQEWEKFGSMICLATILKQGKREDLLPIAPKMLETIQTKFEPMDRGYVLSDKLYVKIITRLGLIFLKPRTARWRYKRELRSLEVNLGSSGDHQQSDLSQGEPEGEAYDYDHVQGEIESVIETLLDSLKSDNCITRWSAAKGIGRIVARLDSKDGDDIVCCVISMLDSLNPWGAWHGALLTIAELSKRGLLSLARLAEVLPQLKAALVYEQLRGYSSIGSNVRDAACYVCWAIARAYHPSDSQKYLLVLSKTLLAVICFDREVNCRRAAAGAFQEIVGRIETVPHGIELMTVVDYVSLGDRRKCYLTISESIAQFEEYRLELIKNLLHHRVRNWDPVIRKLASKALFLLTPYLPEYVATEGLQLLMAQSNTSDFYARHGCIVAIGEIVLALSKIEEVSIDSDTIKDIEDLVFTLTTSEMTLMTTTNTPLNACINFIESCSKAKFAIHEKQKIIGKMQQCIDNALHSQSAEMRKDAAFAFREFSAEYYSKDSEEMTELRREIVQRYLNFLGDERTNTRMGHILALGHLPLSMLRGNLQDVYGALHYSSIISKNTLQLAEVRTAALKAMGYICITVPIAKSEGSLSCYQFVGYILNDLLRSLKDYTADNRGDIGAWVREAAMLGLNDLLIRTVDEANQLVTPELVERVFLEIAQQAVERIDRIRGIAGKVFSAFLLKKDKPIPYIPDEDNVREIFTEEVCQTTRWMYVQETCPLFIKLLIVPKYSYNILLGLSTSVTALTVERCDGVMGNLISLLVEQPIEMLKNMCGLIMRIFEDHKNEERIIVPLMCFLERLLISNCLTSVIFNPEYPYAMALFNHVKEQVYKTTNVKKLTPSVDLFCQMIQVEGDVSHRALVQLSIFLLHRFVWLRSLTASKLTDYLLVYGDTLNLEEENLQKAHELLTETNWGQPNRDVLRIQRNALCDLLSIPKPQTSPRPAQ